MGKGGFMQARTNYEKVILKEIRELPGEALPQVLRILRSIKETVAISHIPSEKKRKSSGLCGIWVDERPAEEIIEDIRKNRTGFGGREVRL
jgi:hypothetical protein